MNSARALSILRISFSLGAVAFCATAAEPTQTGAIAGRVANNATGAFLEGALVEAPELHRTMLTDATGSFILPDLLPGTVELNVSYAGLDSATRRVEVSAASTTNVSFDLTSPVYQLQAFTVAGEREGNAAAITQQRNAANVKSVVALDAFGNLANENPGELLIRLPGVAPRVTDDGDVFAVYVRGIDSNLSSVTIDGNKMVTSGPLNREFRMLNISASFFEETEVIKAPTPDMDADSLGGTVNMKTKNALNMKEKRAFAYRFATKWSPGLWSRIPLRADHPVSPQVALGYQELFDVLGGHRNLGVSVDAYYSENATASLNTTRDYPATLADPVYVSDYRTTDTYNVRTQRSVTVKFDYQLGPKTRISLSAMINDAFEGVGKTYGTRFFINGGITVGTTGSATILPGYTNEITNVRATANSRLQMSSGTSGFFDRQRRAQLDFEHTIGALKLTSSLSASRSDVNQDSGYGGRQNNGGSLTYDIRNIGWTLDETRSPIFPGITQTAGPSMFDLRNYGNVLLSESNGRRKGRVYVANLNATYDLSRELHTTLKSGAQWRSQFSGEYGGNRQWSYTNADLTRLQDAHPNLISSRYGLSRLPWISSSTAAEDLKDNPGNWSEDLYAYQSGLYANTDGATENVTAGYVMGSSRFGKLSSVAGVRLEETDLHTYGYVRNVALSNIASPVARANAEYQGRKSSGRYTDTFPGLHFTYRFTRNLQSRASWSTSVGRPAFTALVPNDTVSVANQTVTINNPNLKPQYANNYDLDLEYYFEPVGMIVAGVFEKDIKDYVFTNTIGTVGAGPDNGYSGQYAGYDILSSSNGGSALIRGLELSYQQQLAFLPSWLGRVSGYANYTYLNTRGNYGGRSQTHLLARFVPKTANAGLTHTFRRLTTRLQVNYIGEHLFTNSTDPSRLQFKEARTVTNLSFSYQLRRGVTAFCDFNNLLHETQSYYRGLNRPDRLQSYTDNAPTVTLGVTGRF